MIDTLAGLGAPHVETLVPLHEFDELSALLAFGFLPVALYPAMRKDGEVYHDYVVMVHTPQPPDFRGLAIDEAFRPFTEQYIELWTQKFLNTNGVFGHEPPPRSSDGAGPLARCRPGAVRHRGAVRPQRPGSVPGSHERVEPLARPAQ